jgi:hypothetical protein
MPANGRRLANPTFNLMPVPSDWQRRLQCPLLTLSGHQNGR